MLPSVAPPFRVRLAQYLAGVRVDFSFAVIDAVVVAIAYTAALVLRFMDIQGIAPDWWRGFLVSLPLIIAVHLLANLLFGAYGHVWEFASVEEAMRLVFAAATAGVTLLIVEATVTGGASGNPRHVPVSVIVLGAVLALAGMGALRFRSRLFSFHRAGQRDPASALVVGTGRTAVDLARTARSNDNDVRVVGFISTNGSAPPRKLAGLPVMGTIEDVPDLVELLGVQQVVIADPIGEDRIRELVDRCIGIDVGLRVLPRVDDVLNGNGSLRDIRDLELEDLLPRPVVATDLSVVESLLAGRRVLVTGAGGSIGSELVRQIAGFVPSELFALDNDETLLYDAMLSVPTDCVAPTQILADVRDGDLMRRTFTDLSPDVVFHAAAHKHVPILEAFPDEAVKTNVVGTANVMAACRDAEVERFVLISTDKAVDPSSMMGASKRIAEMMVQSAADAGYGPVFAAVRFGNVLGSRGSVVPTFIRQIKAGGPVTVSDPTMLRYFMTIGEAVQLVLQASAMAEGGEVFVLDMGEPVRIGDLARRTIRLAGLVPGRDIDVVITGARPGEKHEEILSRTPLKASSHPKIHLATPTYPGPATLHDAVATLSCLAYEGDRRSTGEMLHSLAWRDWDPNEVVNLNGMATIGIPDPVE